VRKLLSKEETSSVDPEHWGASRNSCWRVLYAEGDVDNEVDSGEPSEDDDATEGEGGTFSEWNGMDIG